MLRVLGLALLGSLLTVGVVHDGPRGRVADGAGYTANGELKFPAKYREWVFLGSGLDMSYDPKAKDDGMHMFNNVFVNPEAYRSYQTTGHWPDGTELVLENRGAVSGAKASPSLNKAGSTQTAEVMGVEVHVLDAGHVQGDGWAFYGFDNLVSAKAIPRPASCYTCHEEHAAVDTTFVQFYPTLLGSAEKNKTLSAAYLKEMSGK